MKVKSVHHRRLAQPRQLRMQDGRVLSLDEGLVEMAQKTAFADIIEWSCGNYDHVTSSRSECDLTGDVTIHLYKQGAHRILRAIIGR